MYERTIAKFRAHLPDLPAARARYTVSWHHIGTYHVTGYGAALCRDEGGLVEVCDAYHCEIRGERIAGTQDAADREAEAIARALGLRTAAEIQAEIDAADEREVSR